MKTQETEHEITYELIERTDGLSIEQRIDDGIHAFEAIRNELKEWTRAEDRTIEFDPAVQ